jgi:hypothetical protein
LPVSQPGRDGPLGHQPLVHRWCGGRGSVRVCRRRDGWGVTDGPASLPGVPRGVAGAVAGWVVRASGPSGPAGELSRGEPHYSWPLPVVTGTVDTPRMPGAVPTDGRRMCLDRKRPMAPERDVPQSPSSLHDRGPLSAHPTTRPPAYPAIRLDASASKTASSTRIGAHLDRDPARQAPPLSSEHSPPLACGTRTGGRPLPKVHQVRQGRPRRLH